ncbi:TetR/AcrR family transcriptional regulator [Desulfospira joergensenii]|uniref:TetR/AcrR family transcriptional regulator n=1 Tax=Desulfospira joergensenii TaxID=53329 RepID=UPI0003B77275|nr:TetR/AcrR family transcriptional regulator [Desulfospira joergensenii]
MPRSIKANQKIRQERKERILTGALELFVRNGLTGTKISDVARKTEMSNGLVYHYFSSKEEIFIELIRVAMDRMIAACKGLESAPLGPREKIKYAMDELVKTIRSNPSACLYHVLITQAATLDNIPDKAKEAIKANRGKPYEVITRIISQGQKLGTIRQGCAKDLSFFFWNTVNGLAIHQAMYGDSAQSPELEPVYHLFFDEKGD